MPPSWGWTTDLLLGVPDISVQEIVLELDGKSITYTPSAPPFIFNVPIVLDHDTRLQGLAIVGLEENHLHAETYDTLEERSVNRSPSTQADNHLTVACRYNRHSDDIDKIDEIDKINHNIRFSRSTKCEAKYRRTPLGPLLPGSRSLTVLLDKVTALGLGLQNLADQDVRSLRPLGGGPSINNSIPQYRMSDCLLMYGEAIAREGIPLSYLDGMGLYSQPFDESRPDKIKPSQFHLGLECGLFFPYLTRTLHPVSPDKLVWRIYVKENIRLYDPNSRQTASDFEIWKRNSENVKKKNNFCLETASRLSRAGMAWHSAFWDDKGFGAYLKRGQYCRITFLKEHAIKSYELHHYSDAGPYGHIIDPDLVSI